MAQKPIKNRFKSKTKVFGYLGIKKGLKSKFETYKKIKARVDSIKSLLQL
jgi:hypothetical protein